MSFAISAILSFTVSSDKGTEFILFASFWPSNICAIFPHLALLVCHQLCEVLLLLLLSKKLNMKHVGVVEKLGRSLMQGAFPAHHNELFLL